MRKAKGTKLTLQSVRQLVCLLKYRNLSSPDCEFHGPVVPCYRNRRYSLFVLPVGRVLVRACNIYILYLLQYIIYIAQLLRVSTSAMNESSSDKTFPI